MRHTSPRRLKSTWTIVLVAGAVVFSSAYAFAASLGVSSSSLGAGNASVSSCSASVTGSYAVSYDSSIPGYKVSSITLGGIGTCSGIALTSDLTGTSNASLGEVTHTVSPAEASAGSVTLPVGGSVAASGVTGVSVALAG